MRTMTQSNRKATDIEIAMTLLYIARYVDLEQAVSAAQLITGHAAWAEYGGDELAVLDFPELGGGLYWLCDLREIPEGRQFAQAIVKAGVVTDLPATAGDIAEGGSS